MGKKVTWKSGRRIGILSLSSIFIWISGEKIEEKSLTWNGVIDKKLERKKEREKGKSYNLNDRHKDVTCTTRHEISSHFLSFSRSRIKGSREREREQFCSETRWARKREGKWNVTDSKQRQSDVSLSLSRSLPYSLSLDSFSLLFESFPRCHRSSFFVFIFT